MLGPALRVAAKDLRLVLAGSQGLYQTGLLGLLIVFVFSLSRPAGEPVPAHAAGAIFWLATVFGQVLVFNLLYSLEEANGARIGLLLTPMPVQSVWLGKTLAGLALLLAAQALFLPATIVFLGQSVAGHALEGLAALLLIDWGLAVLGSLLGALAQGQATRESLLSVILFPLLVPVLLAGVKIGAMVLGAGGTEGAGSWLGLVAAFDGVFTGAALILFPFVYTGEE
jgi:heme exporter protein B